MAPQSLVLSQLSVVAHSSSEPHGVADGRSSPPALEQAVHTPWGRGYGLRGSVSDGSGIGSWSSATEEFEMRVLSPVTQKRRVFIAGSCGTHHFLGIRDTGTGWGEFPWHKCVKVKAVTAVVTLHCYTQGQGLASSPVQPGWDACVPQVQGLGRPTGFAPCQESRFPAPEWCRPTSR